MANESTRDYLGTRRVSRARSADSITLVRARIHATLEQIQVHSAEGETKCTVLPLPQAAMNDQNKSDAARDAAQSGDFPLAESLYREFWSSENKNIWDARGLVNALRKQERFDEAIAVGREALEVDPRFDPILAELSWAIWQSRIKPAEQRIDDAVVDEVVRLREASQDPYGQYVAFTRCLLDVAKRDVEQNDLARADRLTAMLDAVCLDGGTNRFDGKTLPGDRQRLYTLRGKVLKAMAQWVELERHGNTVAGDTSICWANNGDVWIERWRILAVFEQGRIEEALQATMAILKRFDEWFVHADLARYLDLLDRKDEALVEILKAANAQGPFHFKVNAFKLLAELLSATGQPELAGPFAQATISVRADKGWPVDDQVAALCNRIGWVPSQADLREVQRDVREALAALVRELDPPMMGQIKTVLPNGESGFLKDKSGLDRFFGRRDIAFPSARLEVGLQVTFRPTKSFDKKKDRETDAATDVRIAGRD